MNLKFIVLAAGLAWSVSPAFAAPGHSGVPSRFTANVPATGLKSVDLTAEVGDVEVTAGKADTVKIVVTAIAGTPGHFIFNWTTATAGTPLPADLHLVTERKGDTLVVHLAGAQTAGSAQTANHVLVVSPFGAAHGHLTGHWQVVLPARLAFSLKSGVGHVRVSGLAGGLRAELGVGDLQANLPGGPVSVEAGVGKVEVTVASPDYGSVALTAGVGDVVFTVNGKKIRTGYQRSFVASTQHLSGPGRTDYTLKVGTGHVVLNLGAAGDVQAANDASGPSSTSEK